MTLTRKDAAATVLTALVVLLLWAGSTLRQAWHAERLDGIKEGRY